MTSSGRRSSESRAKRRLTVDRQSWIQNPNKKLESFAQPLPPRTGLWHIPGYMQQSVNDNPTSYTHQHKLGGPPNLLPTCPEDVLDASDRKDTTSMLVDWLLPWLDMIIGAFPCMNPVLSSNELVVLELRSDSLPMLFHSAGVYFN